MILKYFYFWLLSAWTCVSSTQVLDFGTSLVSGPGSPLSSAVLTNVPEEQLPERFIICSQIKHTKIDNKSPFVFLGQDKKAWLAFSFWNYEAGVILWLDQGDTWIKLQLVERPWTHVWLHLCADVDTVTGNLSVSLNGGKPVHANSPGLAKNKPNFMQNRLQIGLNQEGSYAMENAQFIGLVSNINLFYHNKKHHLESLSKNPCVDGDYMAWSKIDFDQTGDNVNISEDDDVCCGKDSYDIMLPVMASWREADHQCKCLGQMSEVANQIEMNRTVQLWNDTELPCTGVWMPINDEDEEGVFRNTNSGHLATYLPWRKDQPNGGKDENFVALIARGNASFFDVSERQLLCVSCKLSTTTRFKLRGLCKGTKLGKGDMAL